MEVEMSMLSRTEVVVRRMTRADIDSVIDLDRKISGGKSQITYKDMAALDPGGPLDFSFIAEVEKKFAGFILAHLMYMGMPFNEFCVIYAIDVADEFRNRGIGRRMVDEVLDTCSAEGINTVRAIFPEKNEKLRKSVENLGFRRSTVANYDITLES
ncbi:MAG: GNAT family N-acetyltransferase [Dehalococcoidia bacterium]|nr:GNAT family N-acetyltransferase [Dehalococcoidia bacterium]